MLALGDFLSVQCHACIGGKSIGDDLRKLEAGVHAVRAAGAVRAEEGSGESGWLACWRAGALACWLAVCVGVGVVVVSVCCS
jgi:hypothetical protein